MWVSANQLSNNRGLGNASRVCGVYPEPPAEVYCFRLNFGLLSLSSAVGLTTGASSGDHIKRSIYASKSMPGAHLTQNGCEGGQDISLSREGIEAGLHVSMHATLLFALFDM